MSILPTGWACAEKDAHQQHTHGGPLILSATVVAVPGHIWRSRNEFLATYVFLLFLSIMQENLILCRNGERFIQQGLHYIIQARSEIVHVYFRADTLFTRCKGVVSFSLSITLSF